MKLIKRWLKTLDKKMEEKSKNSCECCSGKCNDKKKKKDRKKIDDT